MLRQRPYLLLLGVPLAFLVLLLSRLATQRGAPAAPETAEPAPAASRGAGLPPPPRSVRRVDLELPVAAARTTSIVVAGSPGAFEGRVVTSTRGDSVPGAELTFTRGAEAVTVAAGPDGRFRFVPTVAGRWTLAAATAEGFLPFAPEWGHSPVLLDARPGAHVRNVVVTLAPAVAWAVRVVGPTGAPVAHATVRVLGAGAGETALVPLRERYTTDAGGEAAVIAPHDAVVEVEAPGFALGRAAVDFAARVSGRVVVRLGPEPLPGARPRITGRVELDGGAPAAGARVVAWPRWPDADGAPRQVLAGEDGRFTLADLDPGTWDVVARRPGLAPAQALDVRAGGPPLALRLAAGGRVSGRVRARGTGAPLTPFTLLVRHRAGGPSDPIQSVAVLDPDGRFELDGLPPGPVRLYAAAPGHAPAGPVEVEIPAAGAPPAWAELELPAGGAVYGVVKSRASGAGLDDAEVEIEGEPAPAASAIPVRARVATDADGSFRVEGVPERPVALFVQARGHHARVVPLGVVADGDRRGPVAIDLAPVAPGETPQVELTGIGAVLSQRGGAIVVDRVLAGGGAGEAGLAPGDEISRVDGRPVAGLDLAEAVLLVRGPEGTTVSLHVRRGGDRSREQVIAVRRRHVRG